MPGKYKLTDIDQNKQPPPPGGAQPATAGTGQYKLADAQPTAAPASGSPTVKAQPSTASQVWDTANKGLVSPDAIRKGLEYAVPGMATHGDQDNSREALSTEIDAPPSQWDVDHPILGGLRRGALGVSRDTMDTLSSFTSPVSIALLGTGAVGKAVPAAGKIAGGMRAIQGTAGAVFGAQGAKQIYDAATDDKKSMPDRVQQGLTGAAGMASGAAGMADAAPSPRGMMAKRMNKLAPNEQFTPQEKLDAARDHGISPDLADATGSEVARAAKKATEHSIVGSGPFDAAKEQNLGALNQWGSGYLEKLSKNTGEPAGSRIQNALQSDLDSKQNRESKLYQDLDKSQGVTKPDATPLRQMGQQILDEEGPYFDKHPEEIPKGVWAKVQAAAKGPKQPEAAPAPKQQAGFAAETATPSPKPAPVQDTWSDIHKLRTDLMNAYRSPDVVGTRAEGFLKRLVGAADQVLTSPDLSKMSPSDVSNFRDANEIHTDIKSTYDNPQHPFYHALRTPFASKSAEMMAAKTPELARQTNAVLGPNAGDFQRAVVENIMGRNPSGAGFDFKGMPGRLKSYKPEYLQSLLGSQATSELYKMSRVGQDVSADSNPSGSGKVVQKSAEAGTAGAALTAAALAHPVPLAGVVAGAAAQRGIAKGMNNPGVVDYLTKPAPRRPGRMAPGAISSAMTGKQQHR